MGRKRKNGPDWFINNTELRRVSYAKSGYEYYPRDGGAIRLSGLDASERVVVAAYEKALLSESSESNSFAQLIADYLASGEFHKKKQSTKKVNLTYAEKVKKVFGKMDRKHIKPVHIRQYMDLRGKTAEVQANREYSFMSSVFSWGYERGKVNMNPCKGIRKFSEKPRDRYITDDEYNALLKASEKKPLLWAFIEIAYCCAARQGDVWNLTREQLRDEGIFIQQGKTGIRQIKAWNPRLRKALDLALDQQKVRSFKHVFCLPDGQRPAQQTMYKWFKKAQISAEENTGLKMNFTFHDIKAKAISDYEGDKKAFSGHLTDKMADKYDLLPKLVPTLE